jgi:hypothetical protein
MADIFISYSRDDAQLTMDLARDLEARGYTTWWDTSLLPGVEFPAEIQHQINAAQAVIVIWTNASISSKWVGAEAHLAYGQNKLVTTHAQGFNPAIVPLPFNTMQSSLVTDRALIFDALARRGVHPILSVMPRTSSGQYWAGQAALAQASQPERDAWQSVINAWGPPGKFGAAKSYLKAFPAGVWASQAQTILSFELKFNFFAATSIILGLAFSVVIIAAIDRVIKFFFGDVTLADVSLAAATVLLIFSLGLYVIPLIYLYKSYSARIKNIIFDKDS